MHEDLPTLQHGIPAWITQPEADLLAATAATLPAGALALEVGSLYGGSSAVIACAAPQATLVCVDEFSWSPLPHLQASAELLADHLDAAGCTNFLIVPCDSRRVGPSWRLPLGLLFVDGGHDAAFVRADLANFGPHAEVVVCHDYGNPFWPGVEVVVAEFCEREGFRVAEVADTLAVLRR